MSASCQQCGNAMYDAESYCSECGHATGPVVAIATPPTGGVGRWSATVSPRTIVGQAAVTCSKCDYGLAPIERFCPKCGTARPGVAPRGKPGRIWDAVLARLREATAGRLEIEGELGRGGMAGVYLAHERALRRKVAIKVLRPDLIADEAMVARFLREARTMANFHHPNIVTVYSVESAEDLHYFAMQYVSGRSLDRILADTGPLPVAAMQWVMYQSAQALAYAHQAGVIHRDVKPGNIMIDDRGNAILTDFGIAKVADLNVTATTSLMGTPLYMSPEQCHGTALTPSSDQYALGNVAWESLMGRTPFQGPTPVSLAMAITIEAPGPIRPTRPDCPPEVEAAILKMLAKKPEGRFEGVTHAATALGGDRIADDDPVRDFLGSLAKAESPRHGREQLTPRTPSSALGLGGTRAKRRRTLVRGSVAGAAVAVAALAFVLTNDDGSDAPPATVVAAPPASPPASNTAPVTPLPPVAPRTDSTATATTPPVTNPRVPTRPTTQVAVVPVRPPVTVPPVGASKTVIPPPPTDSVVTRADPPPATVVAPPRPVDRAPEIRRALDRYEAAINNRSIAQLRSVYPGLRDDQESQWRDLFSSEIEQLRGSLSVRSIKDQGDVAEASFLLTLSFKPKRDPAQTVKIGGTATLKFEGGAWRILILTTRAE